MIRNLLRQLVMVLEIQTDNFVYRIGNLFWCSHINNDKTQTIITMILYILKMIDFNAIDIVDEQKKFCAKKLKTQRNKQSRFYFKINFYFFINLIESKYTKQLIIIFCIQLCKVQKDKF
jgi:hypothetical protein